jgi:hypothetical protein
MWYSHFILETASGRCIKSSGYVTETDWGVGHQVGGAIVGARNAEHVTEHGRLFKLQLTDEDIGAIEEVLDRGTRSVGDCYTWERAGPW